MSEFMRFYTVLNPTYACSADQKVWEEEYPYLVREVLNNSNEDDLRELFRFCRLATDDFLAAFCAANQVDPQTIIRAMDGLSDLQIRAFGQAAMEIDPFFRPPFVRNDHWLSGLCQVLAGLPQEALTSIVAQAKHSMNNWPECPCHADEELMHDCDEFEHTLMQTLFDQVCASAEVARQQNSSTA